jgi:SAM-dependent methyltransferase
MGECSVDQRANPMPRNLQQMTKPVARAAFAALKTARHAWLRAKLRRRAGTFVSRAARNTSRHAAALGVGMRRRAGTLALTLRQLAAYRVPGERLRCPACGAAAVEHLEPLAFSRPIAPGWRVGFVSGCRQCGLVFANPLPDDEQQAGVYSPDGDWGRSRQNEHEDSVTASRLVRLFAPVAAEFDVLKPRPGARVLDFGCGLGGMLDTLQDNGWRTYGIEPAMRVAFARHHELKAVPGEPGFDLAILHHVLEHVTNPLEILRQLAAATLVDGYVLISVPDLADVDQHGDLQYCIRSRTHVMAYTTACLEWLCGAVGFRVVSSVRSTGGKRRQRIVLAQRQAGRWPRPVEPLRNARAALDRYYARFPEKRALQGTGSVRRRAALLNLQRRGRLEQRGSGAPGST